MTQTDTGLTYRVPAWLPNDTEESIVGTEWHQEAIGALAIILRHVVERRGGAWGVCEQVALSGLRYPDGRPYDPRPDVMVLTRRFPGDWASISLRDAGAPLFIAEAASDSTVNKDLDAKRQVYAAIGVREYVVFDPTGGVMSTPLLAWRLESGAYVPWQAEDDGWWHSAALDVSLQATQPFLGIRDRDGRVIVPTRDIYRHNQRQEQLLQQAEAERREFAQRAAEAEAARLVAEQARQAAEQARQAAEQARQAESRRNAELEEQLRRITDERGSAGDAPA